MGRYYLALLRAVPSILHDATDRVSTMLTLGALGVIGVATILNRPIGAFASDQWAGFHPLWVLIPIGLMVVYVLLRTNYQHYAKVVNERDEACEALRLSGAAVGSRRDPIPTVPTLYLQNWGNAYEFGRPGDQGYPFLNESRILRLYVYFEPTHAMQVEQVEIDVMGEPISGEWESQQISKGFAPYVYFAIPASISEGKHEVQIVAFGARKWWKSPLYEVVFPKP